VEARDGLRAIGKADFYEVCASIAPATEPRAQRLLVDAVAKSNIDTFGWPIGVVIQRDESRPRPLLDGVYAKVVWSEKSTYDFWALSRTGDFYLLKTLSEDALGRPDVLFFNTRVVRVAETVMFLTRLYRDLGAGEQSVVHLAIRHAGLDHRPLAAVGSRSWGFQRTRTSVEPEVITATDFSLREAEAGLADIVRALLAPLFAVYEFFELSDSVYADIVEKFVNGQVT
jgi:hypothetical protein